MRAVHVHLDAGLRLGRGVGVSADVVATVDHEHSFVQLGGDALGDREAEETGTDDDEVCRAEIHGWDATSVPQRRRAPRRSVAHGDAEGGTDVRPPAPGTGRLGSSRVSESRRSPIRVVTVTYSPGDRLEEFIESLASATVRPVEVVLADNGSTDGSPERVTARYPHVRLLPTGGNVGYGAAANAGLADLSSGHAIIANPDVRFEPGSVDELIAVAERWPRAATVGPAIRTPEGLYPSARDLPQLSTGADTPCSAGPGRRIRGRSGTGESARRRGTPGRVAVGLLPAGGRRGLLVGRGFDPGYFMYFEDVDLAERLGRRGWLHVYAPSAVVVHEGGHATQREPHRMQRVHHTSALRYLSGRHPGPARAPLRMALRAGLGARMLLSYVSSRVAAGARFQRRAGELGDVPTRGKGN